MLVIYFQLLSFGLVIVAALLNRWAIGDPRLLLGAVLGSFLVWMLVNLVVVISQGLEIYRTGAVGLMQGFSILVACVVILLLSSLLIKSGQFPPIHDITTDVASPPEFDSAIRARRKGHNPTDYHPNNIAFQQEVYKKVEPLFFSRPVDQTVAVAEKLALALGWQVQNTNAGLGRIEAYDQTALFGFVDDIVIRVQTDGQGSRVDIRSASRIGRSDWGMNAKRIVEFSEKLREQLAVP